MENPFMAKKGAGFARECLTCEVCQPQQGKKVFDQNMSVSTALPCRISIYAERAEAFQASIRSDQPPACARGGRGCKMHDASAALVQVAMTSHPSALTKGQAKTP
jgi:hypothetical protein